MKKLLFACMLMAGVTACNKSVKPLTVEEPVVDSVVTVDTTVVDTFSGPDTLYV